MRSLAVAASLLFTAFAPLSAQANKSGPAPDAATTREILALREEAWRSFFANDTVAFKRVVPAELVALSWGGGEWDDRARTVGRMKEFAATGMKLDQLHFVRNVLQQYGDAVILYTQFHIVLKGPNGEKEETTGRGTEIFARRDGRWIHTGWHLDAIAN